MGRLAWATSLAARSLSREERRSQEDLWGHLYVPSKPAVDPNVSLMMVEKVPDYTYEMGRGIHKQIKEIKEHGKTLLARAAAYHT